MLRIIGENGLKAIKIWHWWSSQKVESSNPTDMRPYMLL